MQQALQLAPGAEAGAQHLRPQQARHLDGAFRPAELLALQARHLHRDLRRGGYIRAVADPPAQELGPVGEVQVFGEGFAAPVPRRLDAGPPPDPRRAVEGEEEPGGVAPVLLHHEMTVQGQGLDAREQGVVFVKVRPAGLHQPGALAARGEERRQGAPQPAGRGHEIGVEDGDKFPGGALQPGAQRPGFEPPAVFPPQHPDPAPPAAPEGGALVHNGAGRVRRVVQDLDLQAVQGIVELRHGVYQPGRDLRLVVERELHGHHRQGLGQPARVLRTGASGSLAAAVEQGQEREHQQVKTKHRQAQGCACIKPTDQ